MPVRSRMVALVAAVSALMLLPHPAVADERDELAKTRRRLGQGGGGLRDARADAGAVAAALAAADQAVVGARQRLAIAAAELTAAPAPRGRRAARLAARTSAV